MEGFIELLNQYGALIYALLFVYCALKSGLLPLFAGYAAHLGGLDLVTVCAVTFAGGYIGDEMRFQVARRYGVGFLSQWPRSRQMMFTAQALMERYGALYIFLYRYPKGMRTIGALPVGIGSMPWMRFSALNALSAVLWTALLVGAGYGFGAAIDEVVSENWGFISVAMLVVFLMLALLAWRRIGRSTELPGLLNTPKNL